MALLNVRNASYGIIIMFLVFSSNGYLLYQGNLQSNVSLTATNYHFSMTGRSRRLDKAQFSRNRKPSPTNKTLQLYNSITITIICFTSEKLFW